MDLLFGALNLGLIFSFLVVGICLTYRIYNFADITVEGSFTLGGAVSAVLMVNGMHPVLATVLGSLAGAAAGMLTGLIHTQLKVNGLLAGIIVMTGLYSINLHVMAKSNIPLMSLKTLVSVMNGMNPGMHSELWLFVLFLPAIALFMFLFALFLKTDLGVTIRATGNNP
jgi:putative ABC transport system permease protein